MRGAWEVGRRWSADVGLGLLLGMLLVFAFVLAPLIYLGWVERHLLGVAFVLVLLGGAWSLAQHRGMVVAFTVVALAAEAFRWLHRFAPTGGLAAMEALASALSIGVLMVLVVKLVFDPGPITWHRMGGAICAFLLFGVMWAQLYQLLETLHPGAFTFPSPAARGSDRVWPFVYFSFITLTTLGYGDIVPVHPVAQSLVALEGLVGQLYPAVLIARLVALQLQRKPGPPT